MHPINECKETSEEEKEKLLKEFYETRKKLKAIASKLSSQGDGRWRTLINGTVNVIALGDYGADESALPRNIIKFLERDGKDVKIEQFEKPISLSPAVKLDHNTVTASANGWFNIRVCLPWRPLRLRNIEFFIIDQEMDEILLGRPLLKCLGFNLDSHLEQVRDRYKDVDISQIIYQTSEANHASEIPAKAAALGPYGGLWYNQAEEDPIGLPKSADANIGVDREEDVQDAFRLILKQAEGNGLSKPGLEKTGKILQAFRDILRINLVSDPPAKVEPLKIKLKPNHRPVRAKQRRYPPKQHAFIQSTVRELRDVGAIRRNPQARWVRPTLAVPKPGSEKLRFTVDLRAPNRETIPFASTMPDLEQMIQSTAESTVFSKLDMCHAYWQIPLHEDSQECMSIQTAVGVHTPSRLLQGQTDARNHFQCVTSPISSSVIDKSIRWLDDFLIHATTEEELLRNIQLFFTKCREFGLKLHAKKCELFLKEIKFCGRIIGPDGIRYNPRELDTLLKMQRPGFASDLEHFLCATNWMRKSIPEYSNTNAPLHHLLEECYKKVKKRTERAVRNISLSEQWGIAHDSAFRQIQAQIVQSIELAHPKAGQRLCLFTDASETHWGSVFTQVPNKQMGREIEKQDHAALAFLSGSFTGASANWSIVEKEAFSVVESMIRLDHYTAAGEVSLYTDHANLVYIFDPYGSNPEMSRHTANKLMRWTLKLSAYRYII